VHLRSRVVTLLILGMPIGGIIGAAICSWAVPTFGWRIAFVAAGILPLIVAGLMYFWLPESPEFKSINDSATPDEQLSAGHGPRNNGSGRIAFTTLLSREYLRVTIGLSMAFFCALLVSYLFLNWLPILLTSVGETDAFAIRAALFLNVLGMVTTLLTGWLVHRLGSRVGLLVVLVPAIIAMTIAALGTYTALNSGESPTLYLLLGALIGGAACMGAQAGQVGLAAHAFAVENRASGIGLTGSIGRTGSIVSALGGGALIAAQPSPVVFLSVVAVTLVFGAVGVLVVNRHSGATASSAR
jgi:AAHS family 4-hydroxybenzoate transporter-like MFS transporter